MQAQRTELRQGSKRDDEWVLQLSSGVLDNFSRLRVRLDIPVATSLVPLLEFEWY
jgi:hypothetical protein